MAVAVAHLALLVISFTKGLGFKFGHHLQY